jgi:hypothetical protein
MSDWRAPSGDVRARIDHRRRKIRPPRTPDEATQNWRRVTSGVGSRVHDHSRNGSPPEILLRPWRAGGPQRRLPETTTWRVNGHFVLPVVLLVGVGEEPLHGRPQTPASAGGEALGDAFGGTTSDS